MGTNEAHLHVLNVAVSVKLLQLFHSDLWNQFHEGVPVDFGVSFIHRVFLQHPDEAVTWFTYVYPRVKAASWPREYPIIEARQAPGETMFVPSGEYLYFDCETHVHRGKMGRAIGGSEWNQIGHVCAH